MTFSEDNIELRIRRVYEGLSRYLSVADREDVTALFDVGEDVVALQSMIQALESGKVRIPQSFVDEMRSIVREVPAFPHYEKREIEQWINRIVVTSD